MNSSSTKLATLDFALARLAELPRRDTDEVWELAVVETPMSVREDGRPPFRPIIAICVSTEGGMAASEPVPPQELRRDCLIDALAKFALHPLLPGVQPLRYLPRCIRIGTEDSPPMRHLVDSLASLGIRVERTDELPVVRDAIDHMFAFMADGGPPPSPVPALARVRGMTIERIRSFAEAMVAFCAAEPWRHLSDEVAWRIEPAPATRSMRVCIVTGTLGEQFGLAFLASPLDHLAMRFVPELTGTPFIPQTTLWSTMLEPIETMPDADVVLWRREALPACPIPARVVKPPTKTRDGLGEGAPRPGTPALPLPIGVTPAGRLMRPSPTQLGLMEALLRGFASIDASAATRKSIEFDVTTFDGRRTLVLRR